LAKTLLELRVWLLLKLGILLELRVSTWKTCLHRVLVARLRLPLPPLRHFKAKKEGNAKMMPVGRKGYSDGCDK
jgi:hypothetical protein